MIGTIVFAILLVIIFSGVAYYLNQAIIGIEENTWYQNATVIELRHGWYSNVLLEADDGKRYIEYCKLCIVGDEVEVEMHRDRNYEITHIHGEELINK